MRLTIIGGGPSGSAAALAALRRGAQVDLVEKSRLPRHKVCGEFFSPEIVPLLEDLGVHNRFAGAAPARVRRMLIRFGHREKCTALSEPAHGLSRFAFDKLLFDAAIDAGAGSADSAPPGDGPKVIATGRNVSPRTARGSRLFGFKAHFRGPSDDAVELHFFDSGYVGVNSIEGGLTNVCGLAAEPALARLGFDYDALAGTIPCLRERLSPLTREMKWLSTGPLIFSNRLDDPPSPAAYYAGDALSFVDPFTGSGLYCAVLTGEIAGSSAALGISPAEHLKRCRQALGRPFGFATLFRSAITAGWAQHMAPIIPARVLFRLTRPASHRRSH